MSKRTQRKGKAPLLLTGMILTASFLMALAPPLQAGLMQPMISGNACSCHYTEYIRIDNYSMPSQLLIGQTGEVFVNVTLTSTNYNPAKSSYWLSDNTISVTSTKGYNTVLGSPKVNNSQLPNFPKQFRFNLTGKSAGTDVVKITAKMVAKHMACQATDTVQGNVLVIKPKEPPVLSNGRVTPSRGYNQTMFTFAVNYVDADGDIPDSIAVIIDGKAPRPLTVTDGSANTILTGEDYSTKVNGSTLGLGNHTFRFTAADNLFPALGDNWTHQGPKVDVFIAPNKPPDVTILAPAKGSTVRGVVNVSGKASDPDAADTVQSVEVNFDNGTWVVANGTSDWSILFDLSNTSTGAHALFARATDGENYSKPVATYVNVEQIIHEPPTVVITGGRYISEDLMEVTGTSSMGNNSGPVDLVSVWADPLWQWSTAERTGPPLGNGTPSFDRWRWVWNTSEVDAGNYTLNARAWSGILVSKVISADVTVIKINHAPVVISTEPTDPVVMYEGGTKAFKIIAGDRDMDVLSYSWTFDKAPKGTPLDPTSFTYKASYTSAGTHEITVKVSDGEAINNSISYTWHITVLKGFIVTDKTALTSGTLENGQAQAFNVSVFDPEGGKMTYTWAVDGQNDPTGVGPSYVAALEPQAQQPTTHRITLKVQNSQGQSKDLSWSVTVKGKPPVTDPGGKGKHQGADALAVPGLMAALVILSVVFLIYVAARGSKKKTDESPTSAPPPSGQEKAAENPQQADRGETEWPPNEGGGAQ